MAHAFEHVREELPTAPHPEASGERRHELVDRRLAQRRGDRLSGAGSVAPTNAPPISRPSSPGQKLNRLCARSARYHGHRFRGYASLREVIMEHLRTVVGAHPGLGVRDRLPEQRNSPRDIADRR
jgi:hypothetical protein